MSYKRARNPIMLTQMCISHLGFTYIIERKQREIKTLDFGKRFWQLQRCTTVPGQPSGHDHA